MKITELRIGDRVQNKRTKFPMVVVGVLADTPLPINPNKGTVQLDFDDNEGDVWEEDIEDLEFCEPRYKLPEWEEDEHTKAYTIKDLGAIKIHYDIVQVDEFTVLYSISHNNRKQIYFIAKVGDSYPTLEEAKNAAEKHYNELVSKLIDEITT